MSYSNLQTAWFVNVTFCHKIMWVSFNIIKTDLHGAALLYIVSNMLAN